MDLTAQERPARQPAITDVARLAGVSHQTVSRVLNHHPNVREETKLRVLAAIDELGYRRNNAARMLVTGRSHTVGVVAMGTLMFGPLSMLSAVEEAADEAGFVVSVASVHEFSAAGVMRAVERLLAQSVAGIMMIVPVLPAQLALDQIPADVPFVVVDGDLDRAHCMATVDQEAGGRLATRHLLDVGHETVWHVRGPLEWFDTQGRVRGWQKELEAAGAPVPPPLAGDWTPAGGYRAGLEIARNPDVTAVFVANDHMSLGLLRALHERGRRVPEDVSVVGFDDIPEAQYFIPSLTTVRPDFDAVARDSVGLLLNRIAGHAQVGACRMTRPVLVKRDSVAPPRR